MSTVIVDWTPDQVEVLTRAAKDGHSSSEIAAMLNAKFGTARTRNSVIGKCLRMGVIFGCRKSPRYATTNKGHKTKSIKHKSILDRFKPKVDGNPVVRALFESDGFVPPKEEIEIPLSERKSLMDLTETCCRWPIGDPQEDDFHFCNRDKVHGLPYCEVHARRAFQPMPVRKKPSGVAPFPGEGLVQATSSAGEAGSRSPVQRNKAEEVA